MDATTPLAAEYYTEPAWYERDKENIFYRT